MIKTHSNINTVVKQLQEFSKKLANNIHIGALRSATNQVKEGIFNEPLQQYRKSIKKSNIKVTKRRRTKTGWERFKIRVVPPATKQDPKQLRYNVIQNSKEENSKSNKYNINGDSRRGRFTKKGKYRGYMKKDPFMTRGGDKMKNQALKAYITYMKARINKSGGKVSPKEIKSLLRQS